MMKEIKFTLTSLAIFAVLTFPAGGIFAAITWFAGGSELTIMLVAYVAIVLTAVAVHLLAKKVTANEETHCPECGNTSRCYECASRGGWISKAEQDELDRDEDRAGLILEQMERRDKDNEWPSFTAF